MTDEVVVAEVVATEVSAEDAASAAEFESGFAGHPTVVTPPAEEAAVVTEDASAEVVVEAPAIKYRQVTEDEWAALQGQSTQIEKVRADAFGKMGGIERTLKELQQATPKGYEVDITDDVVSELKTEFPEIGDLTLKALKAFAGKLKGTAPAAGVDPAKFEEQVSAAVTGRVRALQTEALEEDYPTWREIVGAAGSDTAYRKWLATQPADYSAKLASTDSAAVIGKSIAKFEAAAAKAAADAAAAVVVKKPAVSARQQRLEAAAVVKGVGGTAPGPSDEDQFEAGFASG